MHNLAKRFDTNKAPKKPLTSLSAFLVKPVNAIFYRFEWLSLSKRTKIIIASILLTILFILSTQVTLFIFLQGRLIAAIAILAYFLSLWALWEGMTKIKAAVLLILPVLYAIAVPNFYFTGRQAWEIRWLTRFPSAVFFGISFYSLLLSQNVFNVAASRTIPLYRAASTVTFLFTIFTGFLLFHIVHVLALPFYWNSLIVGAISFLLILPVFWSVEMEERIPSKVFIYSLFLAVILAEFAVVLSFWPIARFSFNWAISLSSVMFITTGMLQDYLRDRFAPKELYLYGIFGFFVLCVVFLTTSWEG